MDNIKDIVKDVIGHIADKKPDILNAITECWKKILKENELKHTSIAGFKDGVLLVNIDSSIWMYQIKIQQKNILTRLKEKVPEVKSIKFRIGKLYG